MSARIRLGVALAGILLAVIAMARNDQRLTWAAIAVLGVALVLRLVARATGRREPPPEE